MFRYICTWCSLFANIIRSSAKVCSGISTMFKYLCFLKNFVQHDNEEYWAQHPSCRKPFLVVSCSGWGFPVLTCMCICRFLAIILPSLLSNPSKQLHTILLRALLKAPFSQKMWQVYIEYCSWFSSSCLSKNMLSCNRLPLPHFVTSSFASIISITRILVSLELFRILLLLYSVVRLLCKFCTIGFSLLVKE